METFIRIISIYLNYVKPRKENNVSMPHHIFYIDIFSKLFYKHKI